MKKIVWVHLLFILVTGMAAAQQSNSENRAADADLRAGIAAYQQSRFEIAADYFTAVVNSATNSRETSPRVPEGYFWLAKTRMTLGQLERASELLEFYIHSFPEDNRQVEAQYQRGRIFYLQGEYEKAIKLMTDYIQVYAESAFVPNALYWSAESLFSLGRLHQASVLFQRVVDEYPASYRSEAARYRLSVLELREREEVLLELLRSSHQELLSAIADHQRRETEFHESLQEYRSRLQSAAPDDYRREMQTLENQIHELEQQNEELSSRLQELQDSASNNPGTIESQ